MGLLGRNGSRRRPGESVPGEGFGETSGFAAIGRAWGGEHGVASPGRRRLARFEGGPRSDRPGAADEGCRPARRDRRRSPGSPHDGHARFPRSPLARSARSALADNRDEPGTRARDGPSLANSPREALATAAGHLLDRDRPGGQGGRRGRGPGGGRRGPQQLGGPESAKASPENRGHARPKQRRPSRARASLRVGGVSRDGSKRECRPPAFLRCRLATRSGGIVALRRRGANPGRAAGCAGKAWRSARA